MIRVKDPKYIEEFKVIYIYFKVRAKDPNVFSISELTLVECILINTIHCDIRYLITVNLYYNLVYTL